MTNSILEKFTLRGINETICRIKDKYSRKGLTKFHKTIRNLEKTKILRKNLENSFVITETPTTDFEIINIDIREIPTKNYLLTIRDELTKFT